MGIDAAAVRKEAGLDGHDLNDCELRLSCAFAAKIFGAAKARWPSAHFGLQHGRLYQPFMLGVIGQLMTNADTALQALRGWVRFQEAFGEGVRLELAELPELVEMQVWVHPSLWSVADPEMADSVLMAAASCLQALAGHSVQPAGVRFRHAAPPDAQRYQQAFGCPVLFGQDQDALVMRRADLARPLLLANRPMFGLIEQQSQAILARLSTRDVFSDRVRRLILRSFNGAGAEMERISGQLHVSARTLQRKLQQEGKPYRQLLDEVRLEFACHHLRYRHISIDELAYLLGYSESSVFRRSFKRWTGRSPSAYRLQPPANPD